MSHVLCGTSDGEVVELEIESGRKVRSMRLSEGPLVQVDLNRAGNRLVAVDDRCKVHLLDWPEQRSVWPDHALPWAPGYTFALFSSCGRYLIATPEKQSRALRVWDAASGQIVAPLRGHYSTARGASIGAKEQLISWDCHGRVCIWNVTKQRLLRSLAPSKCI